MTNCRYFHDGLRVLFVQGPLAHTQVIAHAQDEQTAQAIAYQMNKGDYFNKQDPY